MAKASRALLLLKDRGTGAHHLAAGLGLSAVEVQAYLGEPLVGAADNRGGGEDPDFRDHPQLRRVFPPATALVEHLGEPGARIGILILDRGAAPSARLRAAALLCGHLSLVLRNAQLVRDLNERNRQLTEATDSLVQAEKLALTGKMAATVAHQMRNPLSVIGANIQLLMGRRAEDDPDTAVMQVLLEKVRETNETVHSLLDLARPLVLEMKLMGLQESLRTVARFVGPRCEARAVELRLAVMPGLPEVWADEQHLQRCLLDLCLNSVEAMPGGGSLVLAAVAFGGRLELRVEDSGPGISEEMRRELFEPFRTDKAKGHGLGLFNVKRACDAMGVELRVGDAEGRGTSFRMSFPISRTRPRPVLESVRFEGPETMEFGAEGAL
jgi:signal transduction histidine kinase